MATIFARRTSDKCSWPYINTDNKISWTVDTCYQWYHDALCLDFKGYTKLEEMFHDFGEVLQSFVKDITGTEIYITKKTQFPEEWELSFHLFTFLENSIGRMKKLLYIKNSFPTDSVIQKVVDLALQAATRLGHNIKVFRNDVCLDSNPENMVVIDKVLNTFQETCHVKDMVHEREEDIAEKFKSHVV